MSHRPVARPRGVRSGAAPVLAAVLGATLAAACVSGSSSAPPPSGSPPASEPAATAPPTAPSASAPASVAPATPASNPSPAVQLPAGPPVATLAGTDGALVPGALGSYTWGQVGSDSPWIIVRPNRAAGGTGPWTLSFDPAVPVATWTAAWAGIRDGRAGKVAGYEEGTSGTASFAGPAGPGPWTLKVEVTFTQDGSAVYFWRLQPPG